MANRIKGLVSKNKRRFQADGFDLDLSYIHHNIIAMGFPAEKLEGVYRNHIDDVVRFLDHRHRGKYRIYNLCSERSYDKTKFSGTVVDFPFDDHHPPSFEDIGNFCSDVHTWLSLDTDNVAVIHCKAGKGRTGVMICAYLVHCGLCENAEAALQLYSSARTMDEKGVTIPSQRRYVFYYSDMLTNKMSYHRIKLALHAIKLEPVPSFISSVPSYTIRWSTATSSGNVHEHHKHKKHCYRSDNVAQYKRIKKSDTSALLLTLPDPVTVCGDVFVEFFNKPKMMKKEKIFHFWFNTFFVIQHELCRLEVSDPLAAADDSMVDASPVTSRTPPLQTPDRTTGCDSPQQQRELFQSRIMDSLLQKQAELQQQSGDEGSDNSSGSPRVLQRDEMLRSSWRRPRPDPPQSVRHRQASVPCLGGTTSVPRRRLYRTLVLDKQALDKANKDKQHKMFAPDFTVKLYLTSPDDRQPHDSGSQLTINSPLSPNNQVASPGNQTVSPSNQTVSPCNQSGLLSPGTAGLLSPTSTASQSDGRCRVDGAVGQVFSDYDDDYDESSDAAEEHLSETDDEDDIWCPMTAAMHNTTLNS